MITPEEDVMDIADKVSCLVQGVLERQMHEAQGSGYREGESDGEYNAKQRYMVDLDHRLHELGVELQGGLDYAPRLAASAKIELLNELKAELK
jgi:hypothetical protein